MEKLSPESIDMVLTLPPYDDLSVMLQLEMKFQIIKLEKRRFQNEEAKKKNWYRAKPKLKENKKLIKKS